MDPKPAAAAFADHLGCVALEHACIVRGSTLLLHITVLTGWFALTGSLRSRFCVRAAV